MHVWIIRRHDDGKFVAPPGSLRSYTADALRAQRYFSREAAARECCSNESPVDLLSL